MSTVDEIRQRLVEANLVAADEADKTLSEWREQAEDSESAEAFVDWLIERETLTEFQGEALLEGHTGPFMLGPYEVREHMASGRLGGVFRALHKEFAQPVSLKVFSGAVEDDPEKLARMGREIRVLVELDHPNVVRSYQAGRIGGVHYLAMEELHGETLSASLERGERLSFKEACRVIRDIAKGLSHLHATGVILRDLRPESIWMSDNGVPKVFEFSGARDALSFVDTIGGHELTTDSTVIGDYSYMAPEQAQDVRQADPVSDIYALGCMFYQCVTGRPPFVDKNPVKLVLKHAMEQPEPPSSVVADVPSQIDETIAGMLAKEPDKRFAEADDVVFALEPYVDPETEPEAISIVPVNEQYLQWVQESQPQDAGAISPDAVGITPELTDFLGWMSKKKFRRKR
jgi:serine/threonine protein kinase